MHCLHKILSYFYYRHFDYTGVFEKWINVTKRLFCVEFDSIWGEWIGQKAFGKMIHRNVYMTLINQTPNISFHVSRVHNIIFVFIFISPHWKFIESKKTLISIKFMYYYTSLIIYEPPLHSNISNCVHFININKRFRGRYTQTIQISPGTHRGHVWGARGKNTNQIFLIIHFSQCIASNKIFKSFTDNSL